MCRNGAASARGATKAAEMLVKDGLRRQRRAPLTRRPWFTCMSDRDPVISSGIFLHQGMAGACKQETKSFYVPCRCRHTPFKAFKVLWC